MAEVTSPIRRMPPTTAPKPTRITKTPTQRASEALSVAERKVARLTKDAAKIRASLEAIVADLARAQARRDFLLLDPDLLDHLKQGLATPAVSS
jgi:hypothetical protein